MHSRGTFWPRNKLVYQNKIPIRLNKSLEITFIQEHTEKIAGEKENCIQVFPFPILEVKLVNKLLSLT